MVVKCQCGALYNNQTVEICPLCQGKDLVGVGNYTGPERRLKAQFNAFERRSKAHEYEMLKDELPTEVDKFLREDRIIKGKVASSQKRSELSIWSQQHLKDRKEFHGNKN